MNLFKPIQMMKAFSFKTILVGVAAVAVLGASLTLSAQQPARSQWDGIYTEAQAKRGEPLYAKACASCHGANLLGGEMAPTLVGGDFGANWENLTIGELVKRIHETMPPENPRGLSRREVVDILAFMFAVDNVPAGTTELPTQADPLNAIKFKALRPEQ
jgi:mono/diheme cytochrome c family protein